jgi:tetratricopeptide (TPR) repeat protein
MEKAKAAGHKAAELLKPAGADPALRPLLREAVLAFGIGSSEAIELIAAAAGEPPAALNDAVTQNPGNAKGHRDRGNWYAGRGLWKKAADDFAEAFRLEPSAYEAMQLGILLVQLEDLVGYREHCRAMLARWGSTENNTEADLTAKTCLIHRDSMTDGKQLVRLAEVVVSGDEKQPWFEWFLFAKGLHAYRTGKHAEALAGCRESRRRAPETKANPQALTALNLVVEAMALQRSGDEGGAQRTLTEAKALLDLHVPGIDSDRWWHDWLAANLLYREAVALLAVPPGK